MHSLTAWCGDRVARTCVQRRYATDPATGKWRWFMTSESGAEQANESMVVDYLPPNPTGAMRQFTVIFPTYIPVSGVQIGVPATARLEALRPHAGQKPLLVWGSSIAQVCRCCHTASCCVRCSCGCGFGCPWLPQGLTMSCYLCSCCWVVCCWYGGGTKRPRDPQTVVVGGVVT